MTIEGSSAPHEPRAVVSAERGIPALTRRWYVLSPEGFPVGERGSRKNQRSGGAQGLRNTRQGYRFEQLAGWSLLQQSEGPETATRISWAL